MWGNHHALDAELVCLQLCHVIGGADHVPYLHTGLVPILEQNRDTLVHEDMYAERGGEGACERWGRRGESVYERGECV